ncbi:hypothetical protein LDENG_00265310 [Lucifuga dentata]|nr:hypothetical protein LDENG_00265310 [Lucifuga dentata]
MATPKEPDQTTEDGSNKELPAVEDAECQQPHITTAGKYLDSLLDINDETFWTDQESYEYRSYSGWEEAVRGWGRVAPMAGIYVPQEKNNEPKKQKKSSYSKPHSQDHLTVGSLPKAARCAVYHCEQYVDPKNSLMKTMPLNEQIRTCSASTVGALQPNAPELAVLTAMEKATSHLLLTEKIVEDGKVRGSQQPASHLYYVSSKYPVLENRTSKHLKSTHRPPSVVPIKNFTFLPDSPHPKPQRISCQGCNQKRVPERETLELNSFIRDKKNGHRKRAKEVRADIFSKPELNKGARSVIPTSSYQPDWHNHQLLPNAENSSGFAEYIEPHVGPYSGFKKSMPLSQQKRTFCSPTVSVAVQPEAPKFPVRQERKLRGSQWSPSPLQPCNLFSKHPGLENMNMHTNTVFSIKKSAFLPPLKSPYLRHLEISDNGKNISSGETLDADIFFFDKKSGGWKDINIATLTCNYQTCKQNHQLLSIPIPSTYEMSLSSSDIVYCTNYLNKPLTQAVQSSSATGAQTHM